MKKVLTIIILTLICSVSNAWVWNDWVEKPPAGVLPNLSHPQMNGLVNWWLAGEGSGDIIYDQIGGIDVQFLSFDDHWDYGQWGVVAQFDDNDDYAVNTNFVMLNEFTVSLWYYPYRDYDSDDIEYLVLFYNPGNSYVWGLKRRPDHADPNHDNTFGLVWDRGAEDFDSYRRMFKNEAYWLQNTWQHVVVTQVGIVCKMYHNGHQLSFDFEWSQSVLPTGVMEVRLGRLYSGLLDDIRIYNYALSLEEIRTIYQTPPPQLFNRLTPAIEEAASSAAQIINVNIQ